MRNAVSPSLMSCAAAPRDVEKASIHLCLFDLDDTLLYTKDLESFRGRQNCGQPSKGLTAKLKLKYRQGRRHYYDETLLTSLRTQHPSMKWGVFTRAPAYYAETLLELAYPNFDWDCLIARETVASTKPSGEGILHAMQLCDIADSRHVVLIGDGETDILAAYNGGCRAVLDRQSWPGRWRGEHYRAIEKVPDALIDAPEQLRGYLASPDSCLPELEYQLSSSTKRIGIYPRLDGINHFYPYNENRSPRDIDTLGRYLANYQALDKRREWHELTHQILQYKDATTFPDAWVNAVRNLLWRYADEKDFKEMVVTVVPHKPGRTPRLEALLSQVETSCSEKALHCKTGFSFIPDLFHFNSKAVSSHKNHLAYEERVVNVRCSLSLSDHHDVKDRVVIVLDDVVTTGATLLHAADCLANGGVCGTGLVALAKTVSWRQ